MGTAARVTGFNRVIDLTGAQQPLPSGGEVAAGEVLDIIANVDWVKVEGPDNLTIDWSGDRGINPQFPGDTVNDRMRTSFALGNHTFKARGAKGAKTITVVATDTGTHTGPCILDGIAPAMTFTQFLHSKEPATFWAEGPSGLDKVRWTATEGVTGEGGTFTPKWRKPGEKTVTAKCFGTTQTQKVTVIVLDVEIRINNKLSSSIKNDIVQLECELPHHFFSTPCWIRLIGPATAPVKVILRSPGGPDSRLALRVDASEDWKDSLEIELPADGGWKAFEIVGKKVSENLGDALIQVQVLSSAGDGIVAEGAGAGDDIVANKNVTVFSFDQAQMLIKVNKDRDYYLKEGNVYRPRNDRAATFLAKARLRPANLDCNAPQVAKLRIGIVQELRRFSMTTTWEHPTIEWNDIAKTKGGTVKVRASVGYEYEYDGLGSGQALNISRAGAPLWDNIPAALKPPAPCDGAGTATSFHGPVVQSEKPKLDTNVGTITWNNFVKGTLVSAFRTYCVVYDTKTKQICALSQADWTLDINSDKPKQQAIVQEVNAKVSTAPAMPPQQEPHQKRVWRDVGTATVKFTKPPPSMRSPRRATRITRARFTAR